MVLWTRFDSWQILNFINYVLGWIIKKIKRIDKREKKMRKETVIEMLKIEASKSPIRMVGYLVTAFAVAQVLGWSFKTFGEILLLLLFGFFSIPLFWVLPSYPWWVYYIIALVWLSQGLSIKRSLKLEKRVENNVD